jgi:hypothetical protein
MNILKEIVKLEKWKFDQEKRFIKIGRGSIIIKKLLMKLTYFMQYPIYVDPALSLKASVDKSTNQLGPLVFSDEDESIFSTELLKIEAKVDLTFSHSQQELLRDLVRQGSFTKLIPRKLSQYKWMSPFLTIIHLPNDIIEQKEIPVNGSFHTDRDEASGPGGSIVLWLPFTDYGYPGVCTKSLLVRTCSHLLGSYLGSRLIGRSQSVEIRSGHKRGEWVGWTDTFQHGGLRNTTDKVAIALIVRFSKKYNDQTFLPVSAMLAPKKDFGDRVTHDKLVQTAKQIFRSLITFNNKAELRDDSAQKKLIDNVCNELSNDNRLVILHIVKFSLDTLMQRTIAFPVILQSKFENENQVKKMLGLIESASTQTDLLIRECV